MLPTPFHILSARIHFSAVWLLTPTFISDRVDDEQNFSSFIVNEMDIIKKELLEYYDKIFKQKKNDPEVKRAVSVLNSMKMMYPVPPHSIKEILTKTGVSLQRYTECYHKCNCLEYIKWFVSSNTSSPNLESSLNFCRRMSVAVVEQFKQNLQMEHLTLFTYTMRLNQKRGCVPAGNKKRKKMHESVPPKKRHARVLYKV